jgi:hypothetical protein
MCFSAIFTSFQWKKLSTEKFRIIFSRLKVWLYLANILKLPLHLGSWHYIWKFCIIFEIWYYIWEIDNICNKIDIIFGNFVLYLWVLLCLQISHYIWDFCVIFVNLLLYLWTCYYICEFRIIFACLLLYLRISRSIFAIGLIFLVLIINIYGLSIHYQKYGTFCSCFCSQQLSLFYMPNIA